MAGGGASGSSARHKNQVASNPGRLRRDPRLHGPFSLAHSEALVIAVRTLADGHRGGRATRCLVQEGLSGRKGPPIAMALSLQAYSDEGFGIGTHVGRCADR